MTSMTVDMLGRTLQKAGRPQSVHGLFVTTDGPAARLLLHLLKDKRSLQLTCQTDRQIYRAGVTLSLAADSSAEQGATATPAAAAGTLDAHYQLSTHWHQMVRCMAVINRYQW